MKTSRTEPTEVFVEDYVPADGWASREAQRSITHSNDLEASVAAFLASGGRITVCPVGATAITEEQLGQPTDVEGKPAVGMHAKYAARDRINCAKLRREMDANPEVTFHKLRVLLSCSANVIHRLFKLYFEDDPTALRIMRAHKLNHPNITKKRKATEPA